MWSSSSPMGRCGPTVWVALVVLVAVTVGSVSVQAFDPTKFETQANCVWGSYAAKVQGLRSLPGGAFHPLPLTNGCMVRAQTGAIYVEPLGVNSRCPYPANTVYSSALIQDPKGITVHPIDPNTVLISSRTNGIIVEANITSGAIVARATMPPGVLPTGITQLGNVSNTYPILITSPEQNRTYQFSLSNTTVTNSPASFTSTAPVAASITSPGFVYLASNATTCYGGMVETLNTRNGGNNPTYWGQCASATGQIVGVDYVGNSSMDAVVSTESGLMIRPRFSGCIMAIVPGAKFGGVSHDTAGNFYVSDLNSPTGQVYQVSSCTPGTYAPNYGLIGGCTACPAGTFGATPALTSCSNCAAGKYSGPGSAGCSSSYFATTPVVTADIGDYDPITGNIGCFRPLRLAATITAGGVPVPNESIYFTIVGLGADGSSVSIATGTSSTDANGYAIYYYWPGVTASDANGYTVQVLLATNPSPLSSNSANLLISSLTQTIDGSVLTSKGPTSAPTGSLFEFQALLDAPRAGINIDPTVLNYGSIEFSLASLSYASTFLCSAPAILTDTFRLTGSCAAPLPVGAGSYQLTTKYSFQPSSCSSFSGSIPSNLELIDLAVEDNSLQNQISSNRDNLNQEINIRTSAIANETTARIFFDTQETNQRIAAINTLNATTLQSLYNLNLTLVQSIAALATRVTALEQQAPFMFRGLTNTKLVSYPNGVNPSISTYLNYVIEFDLALTPTPASLGYNTTNGVLTFTKAGTFRLDGFVHLVDGTHGTVGTGVVAWCPDTNFTPIGPNILNPAVAGGAGQGVPGDDSIISTIITIQQTDLPKRVRLVLLTAGQSKTQITDASTISITRL